MKLFAQYLPPPPPPPPRRVLTPLLIIVMVVVGLAVGFVIGYITNLGSTQTSTVTVIRTVTQNSDGGSIQLERVDEVYKIGEKISVPYRTEFTVVSVEKVPYIIYEGDLYKPRSNNPIILITFRAKNLLNYKIDVLEAAFFFKPVLITKTGGVHFIAFPYFGLYPFEDGSDTVEQAKEYKEEEINPGEEGEKSIAFVVPETAEPAYLLIQLTDLNAQATDLRRIAIQLSN